MTVRDVVAFLQRFAPLGLAGEWDNVGLLLGEGDGPTDRILTCLTVTPEVVEEAVAEKAGLIVSHHPILFRATKRLSGDTPEGRLLLPLLRAGIAVYSPHTAYDNTSGGINDQLAGKLGLRGVTALRQRPGTPSVKLVVFVPEKDLAAVSDAVFAAGAGHIGQYRECSFRIPGTGTFFGGEGTNPTIGERGRREEVIEVRLEVVCPEGRVEAIVAAMRKAHSYEEVAYDIYPLLPPPGPGEGRVGDLPRPLPLLDLARQVKGVLPTVGVQVVGEGDRLVQRVAIVCGAGGELLPDAIRARADVFLTGEARFHDAWTARAAGLALLLPGHHATERPGVEELARLLTVAFPKATVWPSRREFDPVRYL
jgi:dinuclear metal center YbgI/SA1388 family protein